MTFGSTDEFKAAAEFFPAGRIIPQRILKAKRRVKSRVKFGTDVWALPTPKGYLVAPDVKNSAPLVIFKTCVYSYKFVDSPYTPGGRTCFILSGGNDARFLQEINSYLASAAKKVGAA